LIDLKKYPLAHPQVAARVVDGSAVIVLADSGQVNVLNPIGTRVWELADGTRSGQDIVNALVAEYTVSADTAMRDVEQFVQSLVDANVLTLQDQPSH